MQDTFQYRFIEEAKVNSHRLGLAELVIYTESLAIYVLIRVLIHGSERFPVKKVLFHDVIS